MRNQVLVRVSAVLSAVAQDPDGSIAGQVTGKTAGLSGIVFSSQMHHEATEV